MQFNITEEDVDRLERYTEAMQNLAEAVQTLTEQNESLEDFRDITKELTRIKLPTGSQMQAIAQHLENLQAIEESDLPDVPMIKGPDPENLNGGHRLNIQDWYSLPPDQRNQIDADLKSRGLQIAHAGNDQFEVMKLEILQEA